MKAVITHGRGEIELADVAMPEIGEFDCLVRIEGCTFCNSTDAHIVNGTIQLDSPYPGLLGHETVGTIVEVGRSVTHLSEGDRVLRAYAAYPDQTLGEYTSMWGGFAEYGRVTDWAAVTDARPRWEYQQRIPPGFSLESGVLLIPQKEIWSAVATIDPIVGKQFLVTGAGIAGLLFGAFLKRCGAARVTTVARRRKPLDRVLKMNAADDVCLADELNTLNDDYDVLVENTGSAAFAVQAAQHVREDGKILAYAIYSSHTDTKTLAMLEGDSRFARIAPNEASAHDAVCDMVRRGDINHTSLISHTFDLSDVSQAWAAVRDKQAMKVLVRCGG